MLSVTLVISRFWIGMYIVVVCLPRIGKVCGKQKLLSRYEYAVLEYELEDSQWKRTSVLAQPLADNSEGTELSSYPQYADDLTLNSGKFKLEDDCEDPFEIEEDIKIVKGLKQISQQIIKSCKRDHMGDNSNIDHHEHSVSGEDTTCWECIQRECKYCEKCQETHSTRLPREGKMLIILGQKEHFHFSNSRQRWDTGVD